MAEVLFGLDFGACNLKCVRVRNKKLSPIRLNVQDDGSCHTPNAIFYAKNKDGSLEKIIGQAAFNRGVVDTKNFLIGLKRKLEQKDWKQFIPTLDREVFAPEVVEDIFKKIYDKATKNLSDGDEAHAAVTVPIIFTKNQQQFIRAAAKKAGFKVDKVINEAFACIFAAESLSDSLNVVFDFGGSTLDVSIIKIVGDEVQELAAAGIRLGGLDIDRDILEKILRPKFAEILDAKWTYEDNFDFQMDFVRRLKESLYNEEVADEVCAEDIFSAASFDKIILSRAQVDELLEREGYREKIFALLDNLFDDLAQSDDCFDKSDVTKVWAVGGSLHIPFFRALLEKYFGAELFDAEDYDFEDVDDFVDGLEDKYLVVAGGAANYLQKRETVIATNAIPYRICWSIGKNLQRGLEKNMPAGFETLSLPLDLADLEEAGWKIDLYQTFSDEPTFDEAAYLGTIELDSTRYDKKENPSLRLKMLHDGRLRLRVSERRVLDDEIDNALVEQHFLNLED